MPRRLFASPNSNFRRIILLGSRNFLLLKSSAPPAVHGRVISHHSCSSCLQTNNFHSGSRKNNLSLFPSSKHFLAIYQRASGYSTVNGVDLATLDNQSLVDEKKLMILRQKLEKIGIYGEPYLPGQYNALLCPICKGGDSGEKSLSLNISPNGVQAGWTCFRAKCGWRGTTSAFANVTSTYENMNKPGKVTQPISTFTEESLGLEPLCNELLAYFAERMINKETLLRNNIMQVVGDRKIIAFPYRQNGQLVGCKYRNLDKKFWQAKNTQKVFYGLDDIVEADEIIIVEGEMDKLSVEEAGYYNCISVPNGAPMPPKKLSLEELPSLEKDTKFQYLWKGKDYFDKASRIILATDGDIPGQALAEELARRLGKERCRRVQWPKKDEVRYFKDANEVLVNLGAQALRDVIDKATSNMTSTYENMIKPGKVKQPIGTITEESLGLEPLCNELLAYFAERIINKETLLRNNVMQVVGDRKIIAFPYRQNGQLVGCKYRTLDRKFWQAKNTQKVFYGLDDIVEADEIIIVEGEMDKLSVEEAGYYNCISVPSGALQKFSPKELPSPEEDTKFKYLWNCEDYFAKASRIILATDDDKPGQVLAEGLARRLGKERCRRVQWPKKDEVRYFNDANEVLVNLGAEALRDVIDKAELYEMHA